jgi:phosphate transport system substrate-binding protein
MMGLCTNLPSRCSKAASKTPISMPTPNTVCPECGAPLQPVEEHAGFRLSIPVIALAVAAIVVLGAMGWLLPHLLSKNSAATGGGQTASSAASPAQALPPGGHYLLRLSGSNTIGSALAPALVKAWLAGKGATGISSAGRTAADGSPIPESEISATLNGSPVAIEVKAHGSATAFKDLFAGSADIGMASRRIEDKEVAELKGLGDMSGRASEHVIALDGVAIIVPQSNTVPRLSVADLRRIFTGHAHDWSEFGRPSAAIHLYARDDKSGTFDTIKTLVLQGDPLGAARRYEDSTKLEADVAHDPGAIGFIGMPYVRNTRAIPVSDGPAAALEPTVFSVKTENYALSRRLYLYTPEAPGKPEVTDFVSFVLSTAGQAVVRQEHFVDLDLGVQSDVAPEELNQLPCHLSAEWSGDRNAYCALRSGAQPLGTTFHFRSGSSELDNRAARDLRRVLERMESTPDKKIVLAGFADSTGSYSANCSLSRGRAHSVASALETLGLKAASTLGFCSELPVRDNQTGAGREQNRRVEIFLQ